MLFVDVVIYTVSLLNLIPFTYFTNKMIDFDNKYLLAAYGEYIVIAYKYIHKHLNPQSTSTVQAHKPDPNMFETPDYKNRKVALELKQLTKGKTMRLFYSIYSINFAFQFLTKRLSWMRLI